MGIEPKLDIDYLKTESDPNQRCVIDYIKFATTYTSYLVGKRTLIKHLKHNKGASIFDKITPSDEAFAVLVFENNKEVWDEQHEEEMKKRSAAMDDEAAPFDDAATGPDRKKPRWTAAQSGCKNVLFQTNWDQEGKERFNALQKIFHHICTGMFQ